MTPTKAVDTVMFLFRDLITQPGDTIRLHRDKIEERGTCLWGWWKKLMEDVPVDLLLDVARNGDNDIFLFDSGVHEVYRARLDGILVAPSSDGMYSPDITLTPEYYVHLRLVTWLRLSQIERVRERAQLFRTLRFASFPSWPTNTYEEVIGQEVLGTDQLDEMKVTMWHLQVVTELE